MAWHWYRVGGMTAVLVTVIGASPGMAQQQFNWDNYCTVGSLQYCASVELGLVPDGDQTDVTIRVRNLEGTLGSTPWAMDNFGVYGLQYSSPLPDLPNFTIQTHPTLSGAAQVLVTATPEQCASYYYGCTTNTATIFDNWLAWYNADYPNYGYGFHVSEFDSDPFPAAVDGCDVVSTDYSYGVFQTCGDGWVGFSFSVMGTWTFGPSSFVDLGVGQIGEAGGDLPEFQATPEPATLFLLGTGLAGMSAAWSRRRRSRPQSHDA